MTIHNFDLLVVGGGINGTGIARDAAGRHLSVSVRTTRPGLPHLQRQHQTDSRRAALLGNITNLR